MWYLYQYDTNTANVDTNTYTWYDWTLLILPLGFCQNSANIFDMEATSTMDIKALRRRGQNENHYIYT